MDDRHLVPNKLFDYSNTTLALKACSMIIAFGPKVGGRASECLHIDNLVRNARRIRSTAAGNPRFHLGGGDAGFMVWVLRYFYSVAWRAGEYGLGRLDEVVPGDCQDLHRFFSEELRTGQPNIPLDKAREGSCH